jgi:hypothetical protein
MKNFAAARRYAVDLKLFYPKIFEELPSNAPPNKALQLKAR